MANELDENDAFARKGVLLLCAEICGCRDFRYKSFVNSCRIDNFVLKEQITLTFQKKPRTVEDNYSSL